MKIKFNQESAFTVVERVNDEGEIEESAVVTAAQGEVFEGDIVEDKGTSVDFQFGDGAVVFNLPKSVYSVLM